MLLQHLFIHSAQVHGRKESCGDWSTFQPPHPDRTPTMLSLGNDEDKTPSEWTTADYRGAADFHGGQLVSTEVVTGDIATP
ncbi:hypothetical protein OS122_06635 [Mycolicibacterium mucogenicum]|uniref:hypothetical protein n=1 Tax=Mycolicibacterium mucogenicum TaxID=56689 RepID=UPI00226A3B12|nr:hypothetical protein [Mycolicibacterium mucogenicum]MCX8560554.1 hypothetical protein [Mycolicibacterium mucogenicum]